ncbi:hypothetical protein ANCCAN_19989 [Ancylostoma caninum]|uniref:Uncharacterized protein n=1 Tax=Ancylostoma caninum TaxID=29170 RepID=A0A368FT32_ANCCA|nr:hypothetical protein ANCCAN_19989 [Ancylostoma caninum]
MLDDSVEESDELQGDLVGALVAAASSFHNNFPLPVGDLVWTKRRICARELYAGFLDVSVDDDVFSMFEQAVLDQGAQSIKQIRYLENTDLHLEQIHVFGGAAAELPTLPTWQSLLTTIDWSQPADKHPPLPFEEYLLDIAVSERKNLRAVYYPISSAKAFGATLTDIKTSWSSAKDPSPPRYLFFGVREIQCRVYIIG